MQRETFYRERQSYLPYPRLQGRALPGEADGWVQAALGQQPGKESGLPRAWSLRVSISQTGWLSDQILWAPQPLCITEREASWGTNTHTLTHTQRPSCDESQRAFQEFPPSLCLPLLSSAASPFILNPPPRPADQENALFHPNTSKSLSDIKSWRSTLGKIEFILEMFYSSKSSLRQSLMYRKA